MKTAVIYARYSSDNQTEQSIEGQLRVCNEYAKAHDIVIVRTYIDRAMTGTNDNRPDFQRMLKDSDRREWDYVLVYKLDRFSRNKYETAIHKKKLKDNGVKVVSAMENIPDTPEGIILESLLEGMNQYYSVELSQKVRRGMKETRMKGNFTGGYMLYGYKVVDHKIQIDEEKAEVVRYIFDQTVMGVYVKDIIAALTARGVYNRGKKFAKNTVHHILRNEKYTGIYRYNGEVFDNIYPQIISKETFEIVSKRIEANKYGRKSNKVVYLLRGKLKCGYCGSPISAETGTAKDGHVERYYKCFGKKNQNGCHKAQVRKDILEKYVMDNLIEQLSDPATQNYIVSNILAAQEKRIKDNIVLSTLTKEKEQTDNAINNIMQAIEMGSTSVTVLNRLRELEAKREDLERQIILEKARNATEISGDYILQFLKEGLRKEPLKLINHFIKEIILFDDKMIIHYNTPSPINLDESQGFSFYDETVKMKVYKLKLKCYGTQDMRIIMMF